MSAEEFFNTILKSTYTTADFRRRTALMRQYFEKKFYSQNNLYSLADFYKEVEVEEHDKHFLGSLGDSTFSGITKENMYAHFSELDKLLKSAPTLILYTALRMPPDQIERLGSWLRTNMPENSLADVKLDGAAFGGCLFVWNGFMSDYSLRYHLMKHKAEVVKVIGSYAPPK